MVAYCCCDANKTVTKVQTLGATVHAQLLAMMDYGWMFIERNSVINTLGITIIILLVRGRTPRHDDT